LLVLGRNPGGSIRRTALKVLTAVQKMPGPGPKPLVILHE